MLWLLCGHVVLFDTERIQSPQSVDDETVDFYDEMLVEAEESINYTEFLAKLKKLEPKEILGTNEFEVVGSDIQPLEPLLFKEDDFEWLKLPELSNKERENEEDETIEDLPKVDEKEVEVGEATYI